MAPISHDQSYLATWTSGTPIVFVDRSPSRLPVDSFVEDDHAGAHTATQHLIDHGHRRIAFLGDTLDIPTTNNRYIGYRAALAENRLQLDQDLVALGAGDRDGAARALARIEAVEPGPTALFSSNARCTMAVFSALTRTDLAVTAFGDFPMADTITPAITVIDQDPAHVGQLAAQRIIDRIHQPSRRYRRRNVLPMTFIERESCFTAHERDQARSHTT